MNGPEHYRQAEVLLGAATDTSILGQQMSDRTREFAVTQAQVHATLALVAATLETATSPTTGGWSEAVLGR